MLWIWVGGPGTDTRGNQRQGNRQGQWPPEPVPLFMSQALCHVYPLPEATGAVQASPSLFPAPLPHPLDSSPGFPGGCVLRGPPGVRTWENSSPCVQMPQGSYGSLEAKEKDVIPLASDLRKGRFYGLNGVSPKLFMLKP